MTYLVFKQAKRNSSRGPFRDFESGVLLALADFDHQFEFLIEENIQNLVFSLNSPTTAQATGLSIIASAAPRYLFLRLLFAQVCNRCCGNR